MKVTSTLLPGVLVLEPHAHEDARGFLVEAYQESRYAALGIAGPFVQDNWSRSVRNCVRGLHFQEPDAQGKLVWVVRGAVWDVCVDVRRGSPNFGRWYAMELSDASCRQLWVPAGYAHGFCVLSDVADTLYKCTAAYSPASERAIRWNDPDLAIPWPVQAPLLSVKDASAPRLCEVGVLPDWAG